MKVRMAALALLVACLLANLDDVLAALPPGDSKTEEFRSRAEQIRDETIYLKVKMEHHQRAGGIGTGLTATEVADVRHRVDVLREDIDRSFGHPAQVRGVVTDAEAAERPSKAGRISLEFDSLYIDDTRVEMHGRVARIEESGERGKKAGIGAAVGAILGGLLGGKGGAIAGILIGGGGAVAATKGEDVELPAGTVLTVRLDQPLLIPPR
jgi:hypothetical protein